MEEKKFTVEINQEWINGFNLLIDTYLKAKGLEGKQVVDFMIANTKPQEAKSEVESV